MNDKIKMTIYNYWKTIRVRVDDSDLIITYHDEH